MRPMSFLAAALCLGAAALLPAGARGQAKKVAAVAVALDRRLEADAAAATLGLQRFVQNDARFESVDLAARARDPRRAAQADKARALVTEALNLIDEMKEKAALEKAAEAVALYDESDLTVSFSGELDAIAARIFALHSSGDKTRKKSDLTLLFTLKADYRLDPRRVPPDLQAVAEEARSKVSSAAKVSLEVRSTPVSAGVWIDGVFRGPTPLETAGLAPGRHSVVLSAPGYELSQSMQAGGLGVPVEIALTPAPSQKELLDALHNLQTSRPPGADGSGGAVARWAQADEALVAGLSRRGEATFAVVTRYSADGKAIAALERPLSGPQAIEELARDVFAATGSGAFASGRPAGEVGTSAGLGTGRAVGIALGGLAIASLGGAIGLGVVADGKAADARSTPLLDAAAYRSNADSARSMALGANVLYGVAAVAAGLGTWLLVTGGPGASASAPRDDKPRERGEDLGVFFAPVQGGAVLSVSGGFR